MHWEMAATLDRVVAEIRRIPANARERRVSQRPTLPIQLPCCNLLLCNDVEGRDLTQVNAAIPETSNIVFRSSSSESRHEDAGAVPSAARCIG